MDIRTLPTISDELISAGVALIWVPGSGGSPDAIYKVNAEKIMGDAGKVRVKNVATDTYTLVLGDDRQYVRFTHVDGCEITVPPVVDVPFLTGTIVNIRAATAGPVTFVGGTGVTINGQGVDPEFSCEEPGAVVQLLLVDAAGNEWDIIGNTGIPG